MTVSFIINLQFRMISPKNGFNLALPDGKQCFVGKYQIEVQDFQVLLHYIQISCSWSYYHSKLRSDKHICLRESSNRVKFSIWVQCFYSASTTRVAVVPDISIRPWRPILARECSSNARERVAVSFTIIYYINAYLPHAREFSAYARECITRKLSVASGPVQNANKWDLEATEGWTGPCIISPTPRIVYIYIYIYPMDRYSM